MARPADKSPELEETEWKMARAVFAALKKASSRAHVGIPIRGESIIIDGMFDPLRLGRELKRELHDAGVEVRCPRATRDE